LLRATGAASSIAIVDSGCSAGAGLSHSVSRTDFGLPCRPYRCEAHYERAQLASRIRALRTVTRAPPADSPNETAKEQVDKAGKLLGLSDDAVLLLQQVPYKGSLSSPVPTDPLIYRWYEIVNVYGTTIKELIHEEFGDGIMSAINFKMDIVREADPKGDRVKVTLNGKFLPYKTY
jgi:cyanate lyase